MKRLPCTVAVVAAFTGVTGMTAASADSSSVKGKPQDVHAGLQVKVTGDITIVDSGETETEGWVAFTGVGTVQVKGDKKGRVDPAAALVRVTTGGGEWFYGTTVNGVGQKVCVSDYHHNIVRHGATSSMNGYSSRQDADPGRWAETQVARFTNDTCYTYWRKYS